MEIATSSWGICRALQTNSKLQNKYFTLKKMTIFELKNNSLRYVNIENCTFTININGGNII